MRTIADTSSLVRMAQSYHPFDSTNALGAFLKKNWRAVHLFSWIKW